MNWPWKTPELIYKMVIDNVYTPYMKTAEQTDTQSTLVYYSNTTYVFYSFGQVICDYALHTP